MLPFLLAAWLAAPAAVPGGTPAAPDSTPGAPPDTARAAAPAAMPLALREAGTLAGAPGAGRLEEPDGVATDAFGRVYVSDAALSSLQRWDAHGQWLDETGSLGSDPGFLRRPGAVARLGSLGVAVLDVENRRIVAYDVHLRLLSVLVDLQADALQSAEGHVTPVALAADRGGALYVADADRDRVLVFDFAGEFQRELGGFGAAPGAFTGLAGVAVTPRGELVTLERPPAGRRGAPPAGSRLQRLDTGGRPVWTAVAPPWSGGGGGGALAVAVDDSARIAIADEAAGEVQLLAADGRPLARLAGLAAPRALAFAPDGSLLVAEAGAARVRRFAIRSAKE